MAPTDHPAFPTQLSRRSLPANRECKSQYLRHKETQITRNRNSLSYCRVSISLVKWRQVCFDEYPVDLYVPRAPLTVMTVELGVPCVSTLMLTLSVR